MKHSKIFNCIDCGKDITNRHGNAILCMTCVEKHLDRHEEERREKRLMYFRNYNLKKRKGTSGLGGHRDVSFEREMIKVKREKNRILRYGHCSIGIFQKGRYI